MMAKGGHFQHAGAPANSFLASYATVGSARRSTAARAMTVEEGSGKVFDERIVLLVAR